MISEPNSGLPQDKILDCHDNTRASWVSVVRVLVGFPQGNQGWPTLSFGSLNELPRNLLVSFKSNGGAKNPFVAFKKDRHVHAGMNVS